MFEGITDAELEAINKGLLARIANLKRLTVVETVDKDHLASSYATTRGVSVKVMAELIRRRLRGAIEEKGGGDE